MKKAASLPRAAIRPNALRGQSLWQEVIRARSWYLFVLPMVVFLILFRYVPLYFLQIAFRDFRVTRALTDCTFAGFKYFQEVFQSPGFWDAFRNTIIINFYKLLICFPAPIILALLMNEISSNRFKRPIQTVLYLPHFISWIVVANIITNLLAVNGGVFNNIRGLFGLDSLMFLGQKEYFRGILVLSDLWKEAGWGMIIYLAALAGIDPELYDAANVDGANRFQKLIYITMQEIMPVIIVMLILRMGSFFGGSFDQIQSLLNAQVMAVGDTLDTYVFRVGIVNNRFSFSTAAGLFNSVISALFLFLSDRFAKKLGGQGLF